MRKYLLILNALYASIAILVLAAGMSGVGHAAEIKVLVSGGFSAALAELVPEFERATGHKVVIARGGSLGNAPTSIPGYLQRVYPADPLIMVDDGLEALNKDGHVAAGSRV